MEDSGASGSWRLALVPECCCCLDREIFLKEFQRSAPQRDLDFPSGMEKDGKWSRLADRTRGAKLIEEVRFCRGVSMRRCLTRTDRVWEVVHHDEDVGPSLKDAERLDTKQS
jgi:hypothetical protein